MKHLQLLVLLCIVDCARAVTADPVIMLDKTSALLKETEAATQTNLMKITCTSSGGEDLSVRLARTSPSFPCSGCFTVLPCSSSGGGFCLTYLAGQGTLDVQLASHYQVTFSCVDSDGRYATTTADVFIEPNLPPYFTDLKVEEEISQAMGVPVPATDPEGDALTYSMVTYPDTSALEIDSLSGQIRVASGKSLKSECRNHYSAQVYVKDKYHTTRAGPIAVALDVTRDDKNQRPVLTNLNGELRVREDEEVDSVVLAIGVVDELQPDNKVTKADDLTFTMTTVPSSAANLFKLVKQDVKNVELQVESPLDYETQPQRINLKITVNDGFCDSETYDLVVRLVDVNEPPVLEPASQTLESCEGKVDIVPKWQATDPDKDDEIKYVKISPNEKGAFTINEKTGVISTTVDYGIDKDEAFEGEETLTNMEVTIRDKQGEEATAMVTIRFVDCNDNPPVFPQDRAKWFDPNACDTKADFVAGKVDEAKDGDSAYNQNNVFAYSGGGAGARVEPSGAIVLTKAMTAGEVINFQVVATDQGKVPGPLSSSPYFVSITAKECTPPDPPPVDPTSAGSGSGTEVDNSGRRIITGNANNLFSLPDVAVIASPGEDASNNRKNNFWDDSVGWVVMAAILGIALLALLIYLLWRFIWPALRLCFRNLPALCNKCKQRPPPRQVTPVKRQPPPPRQPSPPPGPAFIFGFWKETYSDDDYGKTFSQPTRQAVPGASKGPERVDTNTYDVDPI